MAAAYAAVVSLMHTIQQIENHPFPPISIDKTQVESLTEKLNFFQEFLEGYSHVADELQSRIADAAYAAEDVIESHIVDRIHAASTSHDEVDFGEEGSSIGFYEALQKVVHDMDLIKTEVMEMEGKMCRNYSYSSGSSTSPSATHNGSMVGFDDVLIEVLDKLTRGQAGRQIIPIIGMAGIGIQAKNHRAHHLGRDGISISAEIQSTQAITFEVIISAETQIMSRPRFQFSPNHQDVRGSRLGRDGQRISAEIQGSQTQESFARNVSAEILSSNIKNGHG